LRLDVTGVSGFEGDDTPHIHGNITIENNVFEDYPQNAFTICGFRNTTEKNNTFLDKKQK
jgi:hypothetical protein